jgi:predicted lipase
MSFSSNHISVDALSACEQAYSSSTFQGNGVEVLRLTGRGCDILAFRGTEDAQDAIKDLRAIPWPSPVGLVHSGFYKGVRSVMPQVMEAMQHGQPVVFAGHSKGGAEATIAAGLCMLKGLKPAALITFGAPRAGFPKLSNILRPVMKLRYVNADDAVTEHPWPIWGYRHASHEININRKSQGRYEDHLLASYKKSARAYFV